MAVIHPSDCQPPKKQQEEDDDDEEEEKGNFMRSRQKAKQMLISVVENATTKLSEKFSSRINVLKWPIAPKAKEQQFKIRNSYPAAEMLRKKFGFEVDLQFLSRRTGNY